MPTCTSNNHDGQTVFWDDGRKRCLACQAIEKLRELAELVKPVTAPTERKPRGKRIKTSDPGPDGLMNPGAEDPRLP